MTEKTVCLTVPFSSPDLAKLACDVLIVDKEHKRSTFRRELCTDENNLVVNIYGQDLKGLRVAVNSTLKNLLLIAKTVDMFK